ncbi:hypothetical protein GCM10008908_01410 [Clostridium subterminale]|uniref:rRNA biogenesis protein rrp5 n=1 Tax=Clostridium subterminale TaxID=1550 RepID=A0ABP3VTD6_CLOSU
MDININVNFNCKELIKLLRLSARFFEALDEKESKVLDGDGELPKDKEDGLIWKLEDVKKESVENDVKEEKISENFKEQIAKEEKLQKEDAYILCKEEVTLGKIREKLAAMSQQGDHKKVRELLIKYGGDRLSDVPRENYRDLLKEANSL